MAKKTKSKAGRPRDTRPNKLIVRCTDDQLRAWRIAAATKGQDIKDWIGSSLDAEAVDASRG